MHMDGVCRSLGPHPRSLTTAHLYACRDFCDGSDCYGGLAVADNPFDGPEAIFSFVRHLTALENLNIELCDWNMAEEELIFALYYQEIQH